MERKPNKITIKPGAVVEFVKTTLKGEISIDKGTVVHPTVQIIAEGGPIVIGTNNLIEEGVIIHNKPHADGVEHTMKIGDNNVFEVRSQSDAMNIGNHNVVQMTARLGKDVTLGNGCVIGVGLELQSSNVPDKMHFYLQDEMIQQRAGRDLPQTQTQQLEYLRNMIPNYHKIHKPSKVES